MLETLGPNHLQQLSYSHIPWDAAPFLFLSFPFLFHYFHSFQQPSPVMQRFCLCTGRPRLADNIGFTLYATLEQRVSTRGRWALLQTTISCHLSQCQHELGQLEKELLLSLPGSGNEGIPTSLTRDVLQKALSEIHSVDLSVLFHSPHIHVVQPGDGLTFRGSG